LMPAVTSAALTSFADTMSGSNTTVMVRFMETSFKRRDSLGLHLEIEAPPQSRRKL
jgi:hypothetical protein